jgi:tetratricopeptide (TPR) repeat protein
VIASIVHRRLAVAALGTAALILALPAPLSAQAKARSGADLPSAQELARVSTSGAYLAARHAGAQRDAAAASAYYRAALRGDPKNVDLLERAFLSVLAEGDVDEAVRLAERVVQHDRNDRIARLVLGVRGIKQRQYAVARQNLAQSVRGPITDLAATLLGAWAAYGAGDAKGAVESIDKLKGAEWYALFKDLHAGLILDLAGDRKEAGKRFDRAHKLDSTALRVVQAYGSWLSRNGQKDEALKVFQAFDSQLPRHPLITEAKEGLESPAAQVAAGALKEGSRGELVRAIQGKLGLKPDGVYGATTVRAVREFQRRNALPASGEVDGKTLAKLNIDGRSLGLPRLVDSPEAGAAEVLYGLGAALGRRGGEDLGLVYLQLALYLAPEHPLALLSLADLYEQIKNPQLAINVYERVPQHSPLRRNAEIQLAVNLDALDRTDEAKQRLQKLINEHPNDLDAIMALGNILRARKAFDECAEVYGRGIKTIAKPERPNWLIFYFRGICYERAKQWSKAEDDLKTALTLFPDQPHVLNYLGYSWIDQGVNLDEGMRMIRRAVEQRPDDGYIVDSLGWAYYRLGNMEEAVKHLERAVELKPDDPTINDHLGDAYWKTGRTLEAYFQWSHARDLKPEPEELVKIKQKLESGLPAEETSAAANADKPKKPGNGG